MTQRSTFLALVVLVIWMTPTVAADALDDVASNVLGLAPASEEQCGDLVQQVLCYVRGVWHALTGQARTPGTGGAES
jgi:hypothetical protein